MATPMKLQGFTQGIYKESATQNEKLGTVRYTEDGRCFAYAKAGEALAAGKMTQSSAPSANYLNKAVTISSAIGDTRVQLTFGSAVTKDQFKDGWFHVNDADGEAHIYRVKSNNAGTSTVDVFLYDPIRVALVSATSEVTLTANAQNGVITSLVTAQTSFPTGVPPIAVTSAYYFWNQVKGPAACLTNGTIVIGNEVFVGVTVAGAVDPVASDGIIGSVGRVLQVNANEEYSLIMLHIPGY